MKIALLIPDRGDRPKFLQNCMRMMAAQTLQPSEICLVNHAPKSNAIDITERYRIGYDRLRGRGFDLIALIENDDWYAPNYLETMANKWCELGHPNIIGTDYTIYYNLNVKGIHRINHSHRSSAFSTCLIPDMEIKWPHDSEPYTDFRLWETIPGKLFRPTQHICVGIKHGHGLCGGHYHTTKLQRYIPDENFLKQTVDPISYQFYSTIYAD